MRDITLHRNALPLRLFRRLVRAVREVGDERLEESYTTNFWYGLDAQPGNLVEEVIAGLSQLVRPGPRCIGTEWWLGRLPYGRSLSFHFDRDMALHKQKGQIVHPIWSSILYLNRFPSSPTVILDQVLSRDGKSLVPAVASAGKSVSPEPNQYLVYRGDRYHGVMANKAAPRQAGLRLTLLVNYWDRRPLPPVCRDYDGTIYAALCNAKAESSEHPNAQDIAMPG
jgi:hypothetical protein